MAKLGATKTLARRGWGPISRSGAGSQPVVPIDGVHAGPHAGQRVVERGVGRREVDDDVAVAEDVGQRDAQLRIRAAGRAPCRRRPRPPRRRRRPRAPRRRPRRRGSCREGLRDRLQRRRGRPTRRRRCPRRSGARAPAARRPARRGRRASTASMRASTSSTLSSGMSASTEEPRRFMRAVVDSSASSTRPLTFSLERSSSSAVAGSARKRSSSSATTPHRAGDVVGARAEVQADLARAGVERLERVDAVGQAALLAHLLEQPRGRGPAEDVVEHAQREAALVVACQARARRGRRGTARSPWRRSAGARAGRRAPRAARARGRRRARCRRARRARRARRGRPSRRPPPPRWWARSGRRGRPRRASGPAVPTTSARPMMARPSGCPPKTASPRTSKTLSCGSSSYMAISSSTISRSCSSSERSNAGRQTMSAMTSKARSRWRSSTRE